MEIIEERPELKSKIVKLDVQKCVFNASNNIKIVKKIPCTRMNRNNKIMRRSHSIIVALEKINN
jgi:hypothetical protein